MFNRHLAVGERSQTILVYMDISTNSGTPKWMAYNEKPYFIKMDDLGVPLFLETPIYFRFPNHDFQNHHVKFVFSHSQMD